jgi:ribosomal protein S18 acetylase RimI-like enzyme
MHEILMRDGRVVTIRKLARGDEEALRRFNDNLSERSRYDFMPHPYDDGTLKKVISRNERGEDISLVAQYGDEIIGYFFLWYARQPVVLLGICIAEDFQGARLGRKAMEMLIGICNDKGYEGIELSTAVDNHRAYALYEKVGFTFIKEVETHLGDGSVRIERCMFLPLKEGALPLSEPHRPPV